jgi:hypothetical protein
MYDGYTKNDNIFTNDTFWSAVASTEMSKKETPSSLELRSDQRVDRFVNEIISVPRIRLSRVRKESVKAKSEKRKARGMCISPSRQYFIIQ